MTSKKLPSCQVIPWLPSNDFAETAAFYAKLGFDAPDPEIADLEGHLIVARGDIELHFYQSEASDSGWAGACYIRTDDVDALHKALNPTHLPTEEGAPYYRPLADEEWGMREFHIIDDSGNLLKFGQPLY